MNNSIKHVTCLILSLCLVAGFLLGCTNENIATATPSHISISLPTLYPTETATPRPTATPLPTISPTPLPKPTLMEPCISFYDRSSGDLKFTCLRDQKWIVETVDSSGDVGLFSSLTFDRFSLPHISYYSRSEQQIKIAAFKNKKWSTEIVDQGIRKCFAISSAIRWDDTIFISYYDLDQGYLKVARKETGLWVVENIDFIGNVDLESNLLDLLKSSIALDKNGLPIVSYLDLSKGNLKLARLGWDGQWSSEVVDESMDVGWSNSLAMKSDDLPIVSYFDHNRQTLKLASLEAAGWNIQVLDPTTGMGAFTSIAVNEQGEYAVAYFNDNSDDIKVKFGKNTVNVKSGYNIGWHISLALDQKGNPLIAYYDYAQKNLGLVKFDGSRFRLSTAYANGDTGLYPSLEFVPSYEAK